MNSNENVQHINDKYEDIQQPVIANDRVNPVGIVMPVLVIILIIAIMCRYSYLQKMNVIANAEQVIEQMAEYIAVNISNDIDYAKSSIRLSALTIAQTMTSDTLDNPSEVILPMVDNTPFGGIEYIRADGMNVMNIGEPFDASDREYYIEGIKGNTGIWNNYHPKTSRETLMNFYTPLVYNEKTVGVITGYIATTSQVAPLFESELYGQRIYGILVDENNMVICSNVEEEYENDLTLERFMEKFGASAEQRQKVCKTISNATNIAASYKDPDGEGRICIVEIPDTGWKVVVIVPASSFNNIVGKNTKDSITAIAAISLLLFIYAAYVLFRNIKRRKEIAAENVILEKENRVFNEENRKAFNEISEIRDIIASANMGTWRIEIVDGEEPRMYADDTMRSLLGINGYDRSPENTYKAWFEYIIPEAVPSVLRSVERMEQGYFDENTYLWNHPIKGERYVRCGGTAQKIEGGYLLRGYHYDVDDVVREDQAKVTMLSEALNEKNEYYSTLGTLGSIFYSMHVIDLSDDTVVEINAKNEVKEIVNHKNGAIQMMHQVMTMVTSEKHIEKALEFTELSTLSDRMKGKLMISNQFIGKHTGWFIASFITMEKDSDGKPTKVIYTTRIIDDEKKHEEKLIHKSQTDELTGLLNRRAYEEDIYEQKDALEERNFVYMSLDVNGLKVVNDTLGHAAGDELIIGASQCMKMSLGAYGKLYRTGGDEFIALLFCDRQKMGAVLSDFDDAIENWSGKLVESLSISYGWISREEEPDMSVRELGMIADKRMYDVKSEHYKKTGVDRRGQKDAHKALCNLYTKILKINITEDTYQIVNMDMSEQTAEKGFAASISAWLKSFGESGQVHSEDLQEYLQKTDIYYMREYFMNDKTSLNIFYRRRYGEAFKQVMMEIIPANDYKEDSQSLFLYVKNIDK